MNDGDDGDNDEAAAELTEVTGENSMEPRCNYSEFGICASFGSSIVGTGRVVSTVDGCMRGVGRRLGTRREVMPHPMLLFKRPL
jgi:hypothetical protein